MRKAELVALPQNDGTPKDPRAPAPHTRPPPQSPPQRQIHSVKLGEARVSDGYEEIVTTKRYFIMPWKMADVEGKKVSLKEAVDEIYRNQDGLTNSTYVTLKLGDKGSCKIHSVSDRDREIVTIERYVVMPWKAITRHGKNMTLAEAVDAIFSRHESEAKELERREKEREEIGRKHAEYYEAYMKSETERLNNWVNWYEVKLDEIREAPADSRLQMLERLYQINEANKNCGVTITSAGVINP